MGREAEERRRRLERIAGLRASGDAEYGRDTQEEEKRRVDPAARADYLVRDAMAQGAFDNLKYAGKPLPQTVGDPDPDWWLKGLIQRENLTGLGPRALLLRTEDAELDETLDRRYTEAQVRAVVEDFNARVIDARRQLQGGPPVTTKLRDVEQEVRRWQERRQVRADAARQAQEAEEAAAAAARRRRWGWLRRR